MSKRNKSQRDTLLRLAIENPNDLIEFEGYLSLGSNQNWYTFTQVQIRSIQKRIGAHINLPKFKVDQLLEITIQDNHKPFLFTGTPSYYTSKGLKRGSIQLHSISRK